MCSCLLSVLFLWHSAARLCICTTFLFCKCFWTGIICEAAARFSWWNCFGPLRHVCPCQGSNSWHWFPVVCHLQDINCELLYFVSWIPFGCWSMKNTLMTSSGELDERDSMIDWSEINIYTIIFSYSHGSDYKCHHIASPTLLLGQVKMWAGCILRGVLLEDQQKDKIFEQTCSSGRPCNRLNVLYIPTKKERKVGQQSLWEYWTWILLCSRQTLYHSRQRVDICEIMKVSLKHQSAAGHQLKQAYMKTVTWWMNEWKQYGRSV